MNLVFKILIINALNKSKIQRLKSNIYLSSTLKIVFINLSSSHGTKKHTST